MNRRIFVALSTLFSLVSFAYAEPQISSISSSNGVLIINGSGFGSRSDYSPSIGTHLARAWRTFNNQQLLGDGFFIVGGLAENWRVTNNGARPGGSYYSQKFFNNGRLGGLAVNQSGSPREWYTSFWFKLSNNTQSGKFFRIWADSPGNNIYLSAGGSDTTIRGFSEATGMTPPPQTQWSSPAKLGEEQWHRVEIYMNDNPGYFSVSVDGALQWDKTNWVTNPFVVAGHTWDVGHMIDDPAASGGKDGAYNFDDIYLDHTRARVEIGDAPTFAACGHREVQPPTTWSSGNVTAIYNPGSFPDGNPAYVYVVDGQGKVNSEGFPITIQGSGVEGGEGGEGGDGGEGGEGSTPGSKFEILFLQNVIRPPENQPMILDYALEIPGSINVRVFDQIGRAVVVLEDSSKSQGTYQLQWDGKGTNGQFVASGIYVLKIESESQSVSKKIVVVK